jgi:hypothetical protein
VHKAQAQRRNVTFAEGEHSIHHFAFGKFQFSAIAEGSTLLRAITADSVLNAVSGQRNLSNFKNLTNFRDTARLQ